jgi:hypothetical protein
LVKIKLDTGNNKMNVWAIVVRRNIDNLYDIFLDCHNYAYGCILDMDTRTFRPI